MNHQQWLEWRHNGLGSSDAPAVMGVSPWKTRYELWMEKISPLADEKSSYCLEGGKILEPVAKYYFEKEMDISVFPHNMTNSIYPWMKASLDGIDMDHKVIVEIKCPNKEDHALALKKKVPEKYMPQCQHQLLVSGLDGMYYYSFDGYKGVIVEVPRDEKYIEALREEEIKFWDMVQKKASPPLSEKDYLNMHTNPEWNQMVAEWKAWKEASAQAKKKENDYREKLLELCNRRNSIGAGIKITKYPPETRIDIEAMRMDYPDLPWDAYKKDTSHKFVLKLI